MPPKGELDAVSQKKAKAAVPAWFDQDFVSLFTQLPTSFRRKHEIFYGMPSDHKFMNLEVAFQQLCRVHEEANAKRFTHGTIQFLEAGIVLQIIMNKYVTQNKLDGLFLHWWGATKKGHLLPTYFRKRKWQKQERKRFQSRKMVDQLRMTSAALPWHMQGPGTQAAGLLVLMPNECQEGGPEGDLIRFEYIDQSASTHLAVLLWVRKSFMFTTTIELAALKTPPSKLDRAKSGGPWMATVTKRNKTTYTLIFSTESRDCQRWMNEHQLKGSSPEEALLQALDTAFWESSAIFEHWTDITDGTSDS